jgi:NADPH-dependent 2,4-dienoyl-CoA reductase/sulfur reductase-like enzyme
MEINFVVVGGGPAGIIAAQTAKSVYPEKSVCVIKEIGDGVIPCAIPYMMNTLSDCKQNAMGNMTLEKAGVDIIVDKVVSFDPKAHSLTLESDRVLSYERLILATGTEPVLPPIPGVEKKGVFTILKSMAAMETLREKVHKAKNIAIIGGGFIGAEFADELCRRKEAEVHIIEIMPKLLFTAFDDEFCDRIKDVLTQSGVKVHLGNRVVSIDGAHSVESITLDNGDKIPVDMALVSIGAKPATKLAENAGLRIAENGSIWVDEYMRTDTEDVFAIGDCALKRDFFTRKAAPVWLASTATAEARNAGTNIYGIRVLHQIQGTIAAFSTNIGGVSFASAGMTCRSCEREGFRCVTATAVAPDRHPGMLPGASELKVKLVFADRSGLILGGQICGGSSVGEMINMVALAIQKKVTVRELDMLQIATHPLLTSAPTVHPVINAAHQALAKLREAVRGEKTAVEKAA